MNGSQERPMQNPINERLIKTKQMINMHFGNVADDELCLPDISPKDLFALGRYKFTDMKVFDEIKLEAELDAIKGYELSTGISLNATALNEPGKGYYDKTTRTQLIALLTQLGYQVGEKDVPLNNSNIVQHALTLTKDGTAYSLYLGFENEEDAIRNQEAKLDAGVVKSRKLDAARSGDLFNKRIDLRSDIIANDTGDLPRDDADVLKHHISISTDVLAALFECANVQPEEPIDVLLRTNNKSPARAQVFTIK